MVLVAKILAFTALAAAVNIPFGSYRNLTRKFSLAWWLSIHLPIPFIIVLRSVAFGLPLWTIIISLAAATIGQIIGSKLALFRPRPVTEPEPPAAPALPPVEIGVKVKS